jgi:putative FmdB family regulatory protein
MPIYEYRCSACGEEFEKWLRSMSAKQDICCPRCGSRQVERPQFRWRLRQLMRTDGWLRHPQMRAVRSHKS